MFWVHKRNVSLRRFFYAPKLMFDRTSLDIIIWGEGCVCVCAGGGGVCVCVWGGGFIYFNVYFPMIHTTDCSKWNL